MIFFFLAPTGPPLNPSGMQVPGTITLITLSWSPPNPIHVNGIIDHYRIRVREVYTRREINLVAREDSIHVGPLHPYYVYTCQIAAFTIGLGPFSSPFSIQAGESGKFNMFCVHFQAWLVCVFMCVQNQRHHPKMSHTVVEPMFPSRLHGILHPSVIRMV